MVGRRPKTHLSDRRGAACGLRDPRRTTIRPANVTCGACQRTLAMAEAELRYQPRKSR